MSGDASALAEGMKRMQANDLQGARAMFQQAIQSNPSDARAHGYLGIVKTRLGDSPGGILDLQQAVRLQPNDAGALYNLAVALAQVNRTDDARGALQHALTLEPTNAKARAALDKLGSTAVVSQPPQPIYAAPPPSSLAGAMPLNGHQPLTGAMPLTGQPAPAATYAAPPPSYGAPAPAYGGAPSVYGGQGRPGATYSPPMAMGYSAPSAGTRIMRGIGWGALLGQMWTLYRAIGAMIFGGFAAAGAGGAAAAFLGFGIAIYLVIIAVVNAVVFAVAGFMIGAANMDDDGGAIVGIVASFIIVGLQFLLGMRGVVGAVIGVFFAISFGRQIGAQIATKCQA